MHSIFLGYNRTDAERGGSKNRRFYCLPDGHGGRFNRFRVLLSQVRLLDLVCVCNF